jgi:hypothetical protein
MTLVYLMVTCALDASQFEVAVVFGVPISFAICTLSNIPIVFGLLEFCFALLHIFYVILGCFHVYNDH